MGIANAYHNHLLVPRCNSRSTKIPSFRGIRTVQLYRFDYSGWNNKLHASTMLCLNEFLIIYTTKLDRDIMLETTTLPTISIAPNRTEKTWP